MGRGGLPLLLAVVAGAAASPVLGSPPKQVRFQVTLEANIEFSSRFDRSHIDGDCSITDRGGFASRLTFASRRLTTLVLDVRKGEVRGRLRHIDGEHQSTGSSLKLNSCSGVGVIGDGCLSGPQNLQGGELDVLVAKGAPVSFSGARFPPGACGFRLDVLGPLSLAPASLTRGHLLRRRTITLAGAHEARLTSPDGTRVESTAIRWTLRLVSLR